jgi:hypothetical protein
LDNAGAFAAYKNAGEVGVLMAFPTEHLQKHGLVIDLKLIHFARRPRHQHAYVWFHRSEPNLKEESLFETIKAEKVYFQGGSERSGSLSKALHRNLWSPKHGCDFRASLQAL